MAAWGVALPFFMRAAAEFGDKVRFNAVDTSDPAAFGEWGIADGLFTDGKPVRTGPPPSYDKIRKKIARRAQKINPFDSPG